MEAVYTDSLAMLQQQPPQPTAGLSFWEMVCLTVADEVFGFVAVVGLDENAIVVADGVAAGAAEGGGAVDACSAFVDVLGAVVAAAVDDDGPPQLDVAYEQPLQHLEKDADDLKDRSKQLVAAGQFESCLYTCSMVIDDSMEEAQVGVVEADRLGPLNAYELVRFGKVPAENMDFVLVTHQDLHNQRLCRR